jgi:hypothetical protein
LPVHFVELTTIRPGWNQHESQTMEYAQITYSHDDEFKGLYIFMGIYRTKSNEHKEGKEERINLVETIKGLQKYV